MFRKSFQKGFLTLFFSGGSCPLKIWDRTVVNGHIKRVTDEDVRVLVLEIRGTNVATCFIYTPIGPSEVLGIKLPFFVMIIKNLKKYFSFEIMILDDRNMRRRFRVSNYQTTTKVRPFGTTMPIGLNPGWNQIQFNLADFTKRAYGSTYLETQRIQIHANCRIRRIYFCDKLYAEEDIPNEYRLFYPCTEEKVKKDKVCQEAEVPPPSVAGDEEEEEYAGEEPLEMEEKNLEEEDDTEEIEAQETSQEMEEEAPTEVPVGAAEPEEEEEAGGGDEIEDKPDIEAAEDLGDEAVTMEMKEEGVEEGGDEQPAEEATE